MSKTQVRYSQLNLDIQPEIKKELQKIGKSCAVDIFSNSPKDTGTYANGWTSQMQDDGMNVVVYNKGQHRTLAHLLEYGHRKNNGTTMPPQPHIRPAYILAKNKYLKDLKQIAKNLSKYTKITYKNS